MAFAATRFVLTCHGGHREQTCGHVPSGVCTSCPLGRRVALQFRWQNFGRDKCPGTCASRVLSHRVCFSHSQGPRSAGPTGRGAACPSSFPVCARLPCSPRRRMATHPPMTAPSRSRTRDHWRCGGHVARAPGTGARPWAGPRVAVLWSCPWCLPHLIQ